MAIKARCPDVPALPIFVGVALMDILNGLFIVTGISRVVPDLAAGPYLFFDLRFIDWDHSLLSAVVLSLAWAAVFIKRRRVAVVAALAVFSHFVADWPVHDHDLALYPHAEMHLGYGLWGRWGVWSWALEGVLSALLLVGAWRAFARRNVRIVWPTLMLAAVLIQVSPWFSPMRRVAQLPDAQAGLWLGVATGASFVAIALVLTWLVERAEHRPGVQER